MGMLCVFLHVRTCLGLLMQCLGCYYKLACYGVARVFLVIAIAADCSLALLFCQLFQVCDVAVFALSLVLAAASMHASIQLFATVDWPFVGGSLCCDPLLCTYLLVVVVHLQSE